jgi:hypothetical protein
MFLIKLKIKIYSWIADLHRNNVKLLLHLLWIILLKVKAHLLLIVIRVKFNFQQNRS